MGWAVDITYMRLADALEEETAGATAAVLFFDRGQPVPADARQGFADTVVVRANDVDTRIVRGPVRVAAANNHRGFGVGWLCAVVLGDRGPRRRRWRPFTMLDALRIARCARGLPAGSHVCATVIAAAVGGELRRPGGRVNDWVAHLLERAFQRTPEVRS